ncbi:MAG: hypothetical protein L0Y36_04890, partial [Planctomycetales bacterium]|nr:hypothetical protein [Planctomycetales bacterium]
KSTTWPVKHKNHINSLFSSYKKIINEALLTVASKLTQIVVFYRPEAFFPHPKHRRNFDF